MRRSWIIGVALLAVAGCTSDLPQIPSTTLTNAFDSQPLTSKIAEAQSDAAAQVLPHKVIQYEDSGVNLGFGGAESFSAPKFREVVRRNVDPNYRTVRVYFGTNRKLVNGQGFIEATADRSDSTSVGYCDVSLPKSHKLGNIERPAIWRLEFSERTDRHVVLRSLSRQSPEQWGNSVNDGAKVTTDGRLILFVHGFSNTFEDAALRAAQLKYDLAFAGPVVFYSWPSKGRLVSYIGDGNAASASRSHLSNFIGRLRGLPHVKEIVIIAHSMGARLVSDALTADRDERHGGARISELILAAPDIDRDMFISEIAPSFSRLVQRTTLYASSKDAALLVSARANESPRAGMTVPHPVVVESVDTIDATEVDSSLSGHSYYGDNRSILSDIFYLIRERIPPMRRAHLQSMNSPAGPYWRIVP